MRLVEFVYRLIAFPPSCPSTTSTSTSTSTRLEAANNQTSSQSSEARFCLVQDEEEMGQRTRQNHAIIWVRHGSVEATGLQSCERKQRTA